MAPETPPAPVQSASGQRVGAVIAGPRGRILRAGDPRLCLAQCLAMASRSPCRPRPARSAPCAAWCDGSAARPVAPPAAPIAWTGWPGTSAGPRRRGDAARRDDGQEKVVIGIHLFHLRKGAMNS
jgi:hypothetical protein